MAALASIFIIQAGTSVVRAADGDLDTAFNPVLTRPAAGAVAAKSIVTLPDGKIIAGGYFEQVNGASTNAIVRLMADGSVDTSFNVGGAGFGGSLPVAYTIMRQADGKLLIGGSFTTYNGVARKNIVRLMPDGALDASFDPGSGPSNTVYAIGVQPDGKIMIGGAFSTVNGSSKNRIARLNADGSVDDTFTTTMVPQVGVLSVAIQADGKILIGGGWDFLNNVEWRFGLARLNTDGSTDTSFIPHSNNFDLNRASVATILIQPNGQILIGGLLKINSPAATWTKNIARLNPDGTNDTSFDPGTTSIDGAVTQILPQANGKILVGGYFHTLNGAAHNGFGRLAANGVSDDTVSTQVTPLGNPAGVDTMVKQADGNVLVGGSFTAVGATARTGIARLQLAPKRVAVACDYDGDGKTDFALRRVVSGAFWWYIGLNNASGATTVIPFGKSGDTIVCGDYDGDAKTDIAVWRTGAPLTAGFWILQSSDNVVRFEQFGQSQDNATIAADYDGDGKTDMAVYRNGAAAGEQSYFYYRGSANNPDRNIAYVPWGTQFDRPYTADFDGDGKADIAVQRTINSVSVHFILQSSGTMRTAILGAGTDSIIPADFDGDGKTDIALLRNENGGRAWYVTTDLGATYTATRWGINNALSAVGDYDGDGKADITVYQNDTSGGGFNFFVLKSSDNAMMTYRYGQNLDMPVASFNTH